MFRFCPACGDHRREKAVDGSTPAVVCPSCGHAEPFRRLPLLLIGGASGVGKSTVRRELLGRVTDATLLDVDGMWEAPFGEVLGRFDYNDFALRRCKLVAQNGRHVALFGAETGLPAVVEASIEHRYFSTTHHLALVCDEDVLRERLYDRSNWPDDTDRWTTVDDQVALNRCYGRLGAAADSAVTAIDATARTVQEVGDEVPRWIERTVAEAPNDTPG